MRRDTDQPARHLKTWHLIIAIAGTLLACGIAIGVAQSQIETNGKGIIENKSDLKKIPERLGRLEEKTDHLRDDVSDIKSDVKTLLQRRN